MVKLKAKGRTMAISGDAISASDSGGTVNDIQAGDVIGLYRKRGVTAPVLLNRKDGTPMQVTIPAGISPVTDALSVTVSIQVLVRALDDAGLTDAQKAAILTALNNGTAIQVDDNPWA